MNVGIIKWFGGVNKKTGRANDFGFLVTVEAEYEELYFNKKDVLTDEQNLLESGIYVEFETVTRNRGRKQAVKVKPIPYVGIIDWFNQGINCGNIPDVRIRSSQSLKSGDIVFFFRKRNLASQRDESILLKKVDTLNDNELITERCASSELPVIYKPFIVDYALKLSEKKSVEFILSKISKLDRQSKQQILNSLIAKSDNLFLASSVLRQMLASLPDPVEYCNFINKHLSKVNGNLRQELVGELIEQLKSESVWLRSRYWNQINFLKRNIEYKGFLWDIAPDNIKVELIEKRYQKFIDLALAIPEKESIAFLISSST